MKTCSVNANSNAKLLFSCWVLENILVLFVESRINPGQLSVVRLEDADDGYPPQIKEFMMFESMFKSANTKHIDWFMKVKRSITWAFLSPPPPNYAKTTLSFAQAPFS